MSDNDELETSMVMDAEDEYEPAEIRDIESTDVAVKEVVNEAVTAVAKMDAPRGHTITELITIAKVAMAAPWMVKDLKSVEEAAIKMMYGQELGLGPMFSLRHVYVVNGTPALSAGVVGALAQKHGYYWTVLEHTDDVCELEFFNSDGAALGRSRFTMDDAKTAGLLRSGSGWSKYPRNMLFARALTNGARWYVPAVFNGPIYTPEELRDSSIEESPIPTSTGTTRSTPASYDSTPVPTGPITRTAYPADVEKAITDGWERCPIHAGKEFFKRGRMRQLAHPVGERHERKPWCNHEDIRVEHLNKVIRKMDDKGFPADEDARVEWVVERLTDLEGVKPDDWRIVDLVEIERMLDDETV